MVYLSGLPRSTPRPLWKFLYRRTRVAAREAEKVWIDMSIYGSGYIQFNHDADPKHIPIQEILIRPESA